MEASKIVWRFYHIYEAFSEYINFNQYTDQK